MFPPNLDDGERWLPAEIIPDVMGTHRSPRGLGAVVDRLSVEELARQLAALGLFNTARAAFRNPQPDIQGFRPACNGFGSAYVNGFRVPPAAALGGTGAFLPVSRSQVWEEGRARVLRRNGPVRFMLGRVNGPGKDSGGTGVFLPRVVHNDIEKKPKASGYDGEQVEKQKQQLQQTIRYYAAAAAAAAAEEQHQQQLVMASSIPAAAELTLPQDWTY